MQVLFLGIPMPSLLTISIYDLHHIIGRFVRLYKQVQVVSDCLVFACSILCCQCFAMLPENSDLEDRSSHEGYVFLPQHVIDARKAGGDPLQNEIMSDFSPQKEDCVEIQKKCIEFWRKENLPTLPSTTIESVKSIDITSQMSQIVAYPSQISSNTAQGDELPAVHTDHKSKTSTNCLALISPSPKA